ncbi:SRPBCC family protein [Mycolicibacterium moriokaense]|nr:SRPBCC family protein [Mycolicibacterium moriokaense]
MTKPLQVEQARNLPLSQADVFRDLVPMPLPELFRRWYGPIPPIKETRNQTGGWDAVGQSRTVVLVGGGSMQETLTRYDPPRSFAYTLSDVKGPLSPLVDHIDGEWTFETVGAGTNVTWRWTIHPRSALTAPLLPVFGKLWKGYARQSLEELSRQLVH